MPSAGIEGKLRRKYTKIPEYMPSARIRGKYPKCPTYMPPARIRGNRGKYVEKCPDYNCGL